MYDDVSMDEFDEFEDDPAVRDPRRRAILAGVAAVIAAAMLAVPVWRVFQGVSPPVAGNGLEVCRFDYCVVQSAVIDAGVGPIMTEMAGRFLSPEEAQELASRLVAELDGPDVRVVQVDRLDGRTAGRYDPSTRTMEIEGPIPSWTVLHEVAHSVAPGHGDDFRATVVELARWWGQAG